MTSTSLSVRVESSGILGNDIYLPKCKSRVLWNIILRILAMTSTSPSVRVESSGILY